MQSIALECGVMGGPYPYSAYRVTGIDSQDSIAHVTATSVNGLTSMTQSFGHTDLKVGDFITFGGTKIPEADLKQLVWVEHVAEMHNDNGYIVGRLCRAIVPSTMTTIEGMFSTVFGAKVETNDVIPISWLSTVTTVGPDWHAMVYLPSVGGCKADFGFIGLTSDQLWQAVSTAIGFKGPKSKPIRADIKHGPKRWVFMGSPQHVRHELERLLVP